MTAKCRLPWGVIPRNLEVMRAARAAMAMAMLASCVDRSPGTPRPAPDPTPDATPEPERSPPPETVEPFACADEKAMPSELRRLTRAEVGRAVDDLLRAVAPNSEERSAIDVAMMQIPDEVLSVRSDYRRMKQAPTQGFVDGLRVVAQAAAGSAFADGPPCREEACRGDLIRSWGRIAFRRPLTDAELEFYETEIHGAGPTTVRGLRRVLAAMIQSPPFVYRFEGRLGGSGSNHELSSHELASRLALHFWGRPPDAELRRLADEDRLADPEVYRQQLDRVFADRRTRDILDEFFAQWLRLESIPSWEGRRDDPRFRAHAGSDPPSAELRGELVREILDAARHFVWDEPGTLADLLTSNLSFARSSELARLYGGAVPWKPGEPPRLLPEPERAGLLTRIGLLAHEGWGTRPILRGTFIRRRLFCDDIQLPEDMDDVHFESPSQGSTTRELTAALTEQPGTTCAGCHYAINPLGYALEGFDALGRVRTEELIFDDAGRRVAELPIDTVAEVPLPGAEARVARNAVELVDMVASHPQVEACVVRQYFRFTFGRREDLEADACTLHTMWQHLQDQGLPGLLANVALTPSFRSGHGGESP